MCCRGTTFHALLAVVAHSSPDFRGTWPHQCCMPLPQIWTCVQNLTNPSAPARNALNIQSNCSGPRLLRHRWRRLLASHSLCSGHTYPCALQAHKLASGGQVQNSQECLDPCFKDTICFGKIRSGIPMGRFCTYVQDHPLRPRISTDFDGFRQTYPALTDTETSQQEIPMGRFCTYVQNHPLRARISTDFDGFRQAYPALPDNEKSVPNSKFSSHPDVSSRNACHNVGFLMASQRNEAKQC